MGAEEKSATHWGEEYRKRHGTYSEFTLRLRTLIDDLLSQAGISVVQIECRPKSVDSFVEKLARKSARYEAPFEEITDLVGIRVITYYLEDVAAVGGVIESEFNVDVENSVDKTQALDPAEFGYTGVHYIVRLGETRSGLPEWSGFSLIPAEVQVRTAAQHAWAAVDHKLNYKSEHEIPDELKRRFYRLSALFELADDQFSVLRNEHDALEERYSESLRRGRLDIALDATSLDAYLNTNQRPKDVRSLAEDEGFEFKSEEENPERAARDRRDLVTLLLASEVATIEEFDEVLAQNQRLAAMLKQYRAELGRRHFSLSIHFDDLLTAVMAVLGEVPEVMVSALYAENYAAAIIATMQQLSGGQAADG